jgi:hypothetical protein
MFTLYKSSAFGGDKMFNLCKSILEYEHQKFTVIEDHAIVLKMSRGSGFIIYYNDIEVGIHYTNLVNCLTKNGLLLC